MHARAVAYFLLTTDNLLFHVTDKIKQTVKIDASSVEIEERGVKLRLTVVDTPGFGDSINTEDWLVMINGHIPCVYGCC